MAEGREPTTEGREQIRPYIQYAPFEGVNRQTIFNYIVNRFSGLAGNRRKEGLDKNFSPETRRGQPHTRRTGLCGGGTGMQIGPREDHQDHEPHSEDAQRNPSTQNRADWELLGFASGLDLT
jgi:hypothetical protein